MVYTNYKQKFIYIMLHLSVICIHTYLFFLKIFFQLYASLFVCLFLTRNKNVFVSLYSSIHM